MNVHNPFLETGGDTKGGGLFLENPAMVQNIPCQTSAPPRLLSKLSSPTH